MSGNGLFDKVYLCVDTQKLLGQRELAEELRANVPSHGVPKMIKLKKFRRKTGNVVIKVTKNDET